MLCTTILAVAAFLATAYAAPTSANANPAFMALSARDGGHTCRDATSTITTNSKSAWADDCKWLAYKLNLTPDSVMVRERSVPQVWLGQYGSCVFMVTATTTVEGVADYEYTVGHSDVIDLVNAAIAGLSQTDRIAAEGTFTCQAAIEAGEAEVKWEIAYNSL